MPGMFDYTLPTGETMSAPSDLFTPEEIAAMQAQRAQSENAGWLARAGRAAVPSALGAAGMAAPVMGAPASIAGSVGPAASGVQSMAPTTATMGGMARTAAAGVPAALTAAGLASPLAGVPSIAAREAAPVVASNVTDMAGGSNAVPTSPGSAPGGVGRRQAPGTGPGTPPPPMGGRGGMGTPSAPGGPPGWLSSEMQSRGEYETPERPLSPLEQSRADQERGFDEQMRSVGDLARGRAEAAQLEAQALEQQNQMKRAQVQAAQAQKQEIETRTDQLYQRAQDEVRAAGNLEVDVDRYWSQRGNFARAMGAIGIALGEQARIWGAPSNAAKEMIDDAIERDIAEQQMAIEQAQWRANAADNALARYAETYGSVPAAREAVKAAMYAQAEGEYRSALLARGVAEEQVMADSTVRDLSGKRDEAIGAAREQMLLAQQMAAQQAQASAAAARRKEAEQQGVGLSSKEVATERAKLLERIRNRRQGLQELDRAAADYQRFALNPPTSAEQRGEARLPVTMVRGAIWKGLKGRLDAPSGPESKEIEGVVPDVSSLTGNTMANLGIGGEAGSRQGAVTALQTARARIEKSIQEDEAALNGLPIVGDSPAREEPSAR